jgi:mRNA interferase RelE/StbE
VSWRPYAAEFTDRALRDVDRLDRPLADRILTAIARYADTGEGDVKRLQGTDREWRLRVGDWRVLFTLQQAPRLMLVIRVVARGGAYK